MIMESIPEIVKTFKGTRPSQFKLDSAELKFGSKGSDTEVLLRVREAEDNSECHCETQRNPCHRLETSNGLEYNDAYHKKEALVCSLPLRIPV